MSVQSLITRLNLELCEEQISALNHPTIKKVTDFLVDVDESAFLYNPFDNYNIDDFYREFTREVTVASDELSKKDSVTKSDVKIICEALEVLAQLFHGQICTFHGHEKFSNTRNEILAGFWGRLCRNHGKQEAMSKGLSDYLSIWQATHDVFQDYCVENGKEIGLSLMPALEYIAYNLQKAQSETELSASDKKSPEHNLAIWCSKADELGVSNIQRKSMLFLTAFCGYFHRDSVNRLRMMNWLRPTTNGTVSDDRLSGMQARSILQLMEELTFLLGRKKVDRGFFYKGSPRQPIHPRSHGMIAYHNNYDELSIFSKHDIYTQFTQKLGQLLSDTQLSDEEAFLAGSYFCKTHIDRDPMGLSWWSETALQLSPPVFRCLFNMPSFQKKEKLTEFLPFQLLLSEVIRNKIPSEIIDITWSVQSYLFFKVEKENKEQVQFLPPMEFADKALKCIELYRKDYPSILQKLPVKYMLPRKYLRPGLLKNIKRKLKRILSEHWGYDIDKDVSFGGQVRLMANVCVLYSILALRASPQEE